MLTDKDGEGRLLPWSLLVRLCPDRLTSLGKLGGTGTNIPVLPRSTAPSDPLAQKTPRHLVVGAIVARLYLRLHAAGPNLSIDRLFGLFDLDVKSQLSRSTLVSLLAQMRIGISASEADELLGALPGVGASGSPGMAVRLASLFEYAHQTEEREAAAVAEMREVARDRLLGRGSVLVSAIQVGDSSDQWIPEDDFRRCLGVAFSDCTRALTEDAEDRLVLLAEKNAAGDVRWRDFAKDYAGWVEPESWCDMNSPLKTPKGGHNPLSPSASGPTSTQQSWRSARVQEAKANTARHEAHYLTKDPPSTVIEEPATIPSTQPAARCGCCIS